MSDRENVLMIFVKNPVTGRVKTRLAKDIGDEKALKVYQQLLYITKKICDEVNACRQVWYSEEIEHGDLWESDNYSKYKQQGKGLGRRMKHAFEQIFERDCGKAVIIGSDCALLKPHHIEDAFRNLETHDVVIGPSRDGGYYLLGMRRFIPQLFEGKAWSTSDVLEQTLSDCETLGLSTAVLETLNDVDTKEDWKQVRDLL